MNQETAKQFLPLVQALADGKQIQMKHSSKDEWLDVDRPSFIGNVTSWRVKPEPREWVLHKCSINGITTARGVVGCGANYSEYIRVREILD